MSSDRRSFLKRTLLGAAALGTAPALLAGCGGEASGPPPTERPGYARRNPQATGPVREVRLVAEETEVGVGAQPYRTWAYNGQYPGPEIRVREGEQLRITVENRLPEGTTVHWHGVPVPPAMDGVPGVTQELIAPGGSFTYEYVADPAGSYLYHSHAGLQIDRGLVGPLIIEERTPHVAYDREYVLVLDDFLPGAPQPLATSGESESGSGMMDGGGMMGRGGGGQGSGGQGMMSGMTDVPPYERLLVNGRPPADPATFATTRGDRVRLRLLNPSGATTYRVAVAGHRLTVTHADGRPVEPVTVDALRIGMGERYDVVIESDNPGVWPIMAATVEGDAPPARALLRYTDAAGSSVREGVPEGLTDGRLLQYSDLQSVETLPSRDPDRTFDLSLSGGMMGGMMGGGERGAWTIDGEAYPDAPPLDIHEGERVRFEMVNRSMMLHPMHLHGHFFRVGNALKDTVLVDPHMGRQQFTFLADHPGEWFFHCHHAYHLEAGMARIVRYV